MNFEGSNLNSMHHIQSDSYLNITTIGSKNYSTIGPEMGNETEL